jgi:hypothetical protein
MDGESMKPVIKTHGAHGYQGRRASRGSRIFSKVIKGINQGDVESAFKKIDEENMKKEGESYGR